MNAISRQKNNKKSLEACKKKKNAPHNQGYAKRRKFSATSGSTIKNTASIIADSANHSSGLKDLFAVILRDLQK